MLIFSACSREKKYFFLSPQKTFFECKFFFFKDRYYNFKNIFAEKYDENYWPFLLKLLLVYCFFKKNANFFRRKLAKIDENCGHNIDPWTGTRCMVCMQFLSCPPVIVIVVASQRS
jgi:hypothetical protein